MLKSFINGVQGRDYFASRREEAIEITGRGLGPRGHLIVGFQEGNDTRLPNVNDSDTRARATDAGLRLQAIGTIVLRYGLVLVIAWIGLMKFTDYEAKGIQPLVERSPLMSWMYSFLTVRAFSTALGIVEITIAILIALRHWSAKVSAVGSAAAVVMFLTTLSFLFSTPGWEPILGGFPALSASAGQFLVKDVVLLGAAIWLLGEAWTCSAGMAHRVKR